MASTFRAKALRGGIKISPVREAQESQRLRASLERKLVFNMMTLFANLGNEGRAEYEQRREISLTSSSIDNKVRQVLEPHYRTVIENFAIRAFLHRKQDSQFEEQIRNFLRIFGFTAMFNISNKTRNILQNAIITGQLAGNGPSVIAQTIFDLMRGDFSKRRAITIARTETHSAASYSHYEMGKTSNTPDLMKQWVSVSDGRTRSHHSALNGVQIPMDDDFIVPVNGVEYRMKRPADPKGGPANTINCRCVLIFVQPQDVIIDT